jgi:hypothetical protein
MMVMSKQRPKVPAAAAAESADKRKRNVIFVTLDDATEAALQQFIKSQRIAPERSAIGFAALVEFLTREGFAPAGEK